jgi:hypothetical protein
MKAPVIPALALGGALILAACGSAASPSPTATVSPTLTPAPTVAPTPTPTATPIATPTPAPPPAPGGVTHTRNLSAASNKGNVFPRDPASGDYSGHDIPSGQHVFLEVRDTTQEVEYDGAP